jgi:hypothetical protein
LQTLCKSRWKPKPHKLPLHRKPHREPQNSKLLRLNKKRQQSEKPLLKDKLLQNKKRLRQPLSWPKSRLAPSA